MCPKPKPFVVALPSLTPRPSSLFLLLWGPIPPAIDALAPDPSFSCAKYTQNSNDKDPGISAHAQALEAEPRELIIV